MSTTLYGIKSCDTCRKARRWLDRAGVQYDYHDLRENGIDAETLRDWCDRLGWEALLNRRSTTWRGLAEDERANLDDEAAVELMLRHPTLVKRPVLEAGGSTCVGFDESRYRTLVAS
ncbi:ArsC family reductase [Ectothiorhodospiraceae bacterium WFHF3C12]|nr:ArsC family reductase [Ectothiorhodospiraceae bacterium WFHF3C12]